MLPELVGLNTTPSGFAFASNPIFISGAEMVGEQPLTAYTFRVKVGADEVYWGRMNYPYSINIADIVKSHIKPINEDALKDSATVYGPVVCVESYDEMLTRLITVGVDGEVDFSFVALCGGVSRQNLRAMAALPGKDIFTERFLAKDANFFLTTRTAGWKIEMKETELYPLFFVCDSSSTTLRVVERVTGTEWTTSAISRGIFALDIDLLRRVFFENRGVLANYFDLYRDGDFACRIIITQAENSRDRTRVKFRNSLGVFEIVELTGNPSVVLSDSDEDEGVTFKKYDQVIDDFVSARDRVEQTRSITISTGVKTAAEALFVMGMLASDEVYLLDVARQPIRVIPEADEFSYALRPDDPQNFTIIFKEVDTETFLTPDIIDGSESRRGRVFTDQFSSEFN